MVMALSRIQLALRFSHAARSGPVGGISIAIGSPGVSMRIVFVAAASVNSKRLRSPIGQLLQKSDLPIPEIGIYCTA
jgi:hypothetical protein